MQFRMPGNQHVNTPLLSVIWASCGNISGASVAKIPNESGIARGRRQMAPPYGWIVSDRLRRMPPVVSLADPARIVVVLYKPCFQGFFFLAGYDEKPFFCHSYPFCTF